MFSQGVDKQAKVKQPSKNRRNWSVAGESWDQAFNFYHFLSREGRRKACEDALKAEIEEASQRKNVILCALTNHPRPELIELMK